MLKSDADYYENYCSYCILKEFYIQAYVEAVPYRTCTIFWAMNGIYYRSKLSLLFKNSTTMFQSTGMGPQLLHSLNTYIMLHLC